ncbi:MAG: hypothetical protein ACRD2F_06975, partial [Terriglobales bacterium]
MQGLAVWFAVLLAAMGLGAQSSRGGRAVCPAGKGGTKGRAIPPPLQWLGPRRSSRQAPASARQAAFRRLERAGYQAFYNLNYAATLADFHRLLRLAPNDPEVWNHLAQARLYQEMYRVGALQLSLYGKHNGFFRARRRPLDPRADAAFLAADRRARRLAQRELAHGSPDAEAQYALAAAWGLQGTYDFTLRKAYFAALGDAVKAARYARAAARARPGWAAPQLILGVHDYIAGSLPWTVRWLAHMAGFSGSRREGLERLQRIAVSGAPERVEAQILLAVIDRRQGWNRRAAAWLRGLRRQYPGNALFAAALAATEEAAGEHRRALADYRWLARAPHSDAPSYAQLPWARIWYQVGAIHRRLGQSAAALRAYARAEQVPGAPARWRQKAALASGEIEDAAGRRQAAVADYRRCIARNPASPQARAARRWLRQAYDPPGQHQ